MRTRTITSFRSVGGLDWRSTAVHRLALIDPAAVPQALRDVGFEAVIIPRHMAVRVAPGLAALLARKRAAVRSPAREATA